MKTIRERLLAKAVINPETGCWEWAGGRDRYGYGRLHVGGSKYVSVHRLSYELTFDRIPSGLVIDHLCRVRHCLNPAHLEVVTSRVNTLRGDTIQAANAAKTHCDSGHEYTPDNTYIRPDGCRDCRACFRIRTARYKARKRAAS